jgi:uncharacterized protein involved in exopolysaccharide biosynthesis
MADRATSAIATATDADPGAITAREVLRFMGRHAIAISVGALICAAAAFLLASLLPRQYRSIVVMVPSDAIEGQSGGGLMSQLGGLAQVAGLPVSGNSARDEAYEILHSRALAWHFIEANHLAPMMFPKRWDAQAHRWKTTGRGEPSPAEQIAKFNSKISAVSQEKLSGTIRVSITWPDRTQAAQWANALVIMANDQLRERHVKDSTEMVDYLDKQIENTQSTEVRQALYELMERELRKSAIAAVSREYAFKVVDPAMVADVRDWVTPNRVVYSLIGALIGAAGGALFGSRRTARQRTRGVPEEKP